MRRETAWRWIWLITFAVAFAWVETSVVVYLRQIYYGSIFNFSFPIFVKWSAGGIWLDQSARIELGREAATILMLVTAGCLAGRNAWQKFSFFMIAFGIWDIFYYVWLWVTVRWPDGLMTWDLLFLLPLPWTGPVITPVLIALAMAAAGTLIIHYDEQGVRFAWRWYDWTVILGCGLLMMIAFCWDWENILRVPHEPPFSGIPERFVWWLFLPAYAVSVAWFGLRLRGFVTALRRGRPARAQ